MKLLEKIEEKELGAVVSRWTGNDASGYFNSALVNITDTRDLVLHWRKTKDHKPVFVGCFRMYPRNLIRAGHCAEKGGKVRIILYHIENGDIRLSGHRHDPVALFLGKLG